MNRLMHLKRAVSTLCCGIFDWLRSIKKPFICLFAIHLVAIFALLRANVNYIDDMGRANAGYTGWSNFSRHLSDFLSFFIHTDSFLSEISPLPQIIAILLLSLTGVIMIYIITGRTNVSFWTLAAVIPLGISPYFLECLSYKYDAPYMALSILASVVPFLAFRGRYRYPVFFVVSVFSILTVCMTYQAASGIFPVLTIFLCLQKWNAAQKLQEIGKFLLAAVLAYVYGMIVFRIRIMKPVDGYVSSSVPSSEQFLPSVMRNLQQYLSYVRSDFTMFWKILIFLIGIFFVAAMVYHSKQQKVLALLVTCCSLAAMSLISFGVYSMLAKPLFAPRAMFGVGVFLAVISVYAVDMGFAPVKLVMAVLSWTFFVFSFTYGNALSVQKEYTEYRTMLVIEELNEMNQLTQGNVKNVQIAGSIGYAPSLTGVMQRYGILSRLIPVTFREEWHWGGYRFYNYYGLKNIRHDSSVDLKTCNLPVIKDTMFFTLKGSGDNYLVELK